MSVMSVFFQAEDGIRDATVTGVQTCALPIWNMLRNPYVDVWGHPTLYAVKYGIPLDLATWGGLVEVCMESQVLIEFNRKYGLPPEGLRALVRERNGRYVAGREAH